MLNPQLGGVQSSEDDAAVLKADRMGQVIADRSAAAVDFDDDARVRMKLTLKAQ